MNGYGPTEEIALGIRGVMSRCGIQHSDCGESPLFLFSTGRGSGAEGFAAALSATFALADEIAVPPGAVDGLARQLIGHRLSSCAGLLAAPGRCILGRE